MPSGVDCPQSSNRFPASVFSLWLKAHGVGRVSAFSHKCKIRAAAPLWLNVRRLRPPCRFSQSATDPSAWRLQPERNCPCLAGRFRHDELAGTGPGDIHSRCSGERRFIAFEPSVAFRVSSHASWSMQACRASDLPSRRSEGQPGHKPIVRPHSFWSWWFSSGSHLVATCLTQPNGSNGCRRALIEGVIADVVDGVQALGELDFARECRRRGLPEPSRQVVRRGRFGRSYLDVYFDEFGIIVEIEGAHHDDVLNPSDDALRQNDLSRHADGFLRVPVIGFRTECDAFMRQLEDELVRHGWRCPVT